MQLETRRSMVRDTFRDRVLTALDKAANQCFGPVVGQNDSGSTDADLPRLFAAIDAQVEVVAERFGLTLTDDRN